MFWGSNKIENKYFFAKTDKELHLCPYECKIMLLGILGWCMCSYYGPKLEVHIKLPSYHTWLHLNCLFLPK